MRIITGVLALALAAALAGCAGPPPGQAAQQAAAQRAEAMADVPENHPHPPGVIVSSPADPQGPLRCWNNGEDTVCKRDTP